MFWKPSMPGPVAERIEQKLIAEFAPVRMVVQDQSDAHRGHAGAAGRTETHFRVEIVSASFEGLGRVARERLVHAALSAELAEHVHALSVAARTPAEENIFSPPTGPDSGVWGFRHALRKKRRMTP
jgi:BolA protein